MFRMMPHTLLATLALMALGVATSCSRPDEPMPEPDPLSPDTTAVDSTHVDTLAQDSVMVPDTVVNPMAGITVYGYVTSTLGQPIEGVVVSDGYEVTTTDASGLYRLASGKRHGYVFISIPSGYEVSCTGVFPDFHKDLKCVADSLEEADFMLSPDPNQQQYTMLVLGDMHLANRTKDIEQFGYAVDDMNAYRTSHSGDKIYALTLGDMTWDLYWVTNDYDLSDYKQEVNKDFFGLPIFHCIGNHDHEMAQAGDFNTVIAYKRIICPTYYSFNIGGIHYVVLDNILCTNPGDGTRSYNVTLAQEQLDWLRKDLSYVNKSVPVVVVMHAPQYTDAGVLYMTNAAALRSALSGYQAYYLTGHTHRLYNIDKGANYEMNSGSVCATWWWTGKYTKGLNQAKDGSPGGYRILKINGSQLSWQYKATGYTTDYQFDSFDRNEILINADLFPSATKATAAQKTSFNTDCGEYASADNSNTVLIDVFDYDPSWTIQVTENGISLPVTQVRMKNPLHLLAYEYQRYNVGSNPTSDFKTCATPNMFKVQASSATSTLEITVTDRFGRTYRETMTRPKVFSLDAYNRSAYKN